MTQLDSRTSDLLQKFEALKIRHAQMSQLIDTHTAMVKKLEPMYKKAVQQLEQVLEKKMELDTLLAHTEQLIIDTKAKLKGFSEDS